MHKKKNCSESEISLWPENNDVRALITESKIKEMNILLMGKQ